MDHAGNLLMHWKSRHLRTGRRRAQGLGTERIDDSSLRTSSAQSTSVCSQRHSSGKIGRDHLKVCNVSGAVASFERVSGLDVGRNRDRRLWIDLSPRRQLEQLGGAIECGSCTTDYLGRLIIIDAYSGKPRQIGAGCQFILSIKGDTSRRGTLQFQPNAHRGSGDYSTRN